MEKNYNTMKMMQYLTKAIKMSDEMPELNRLEVLEKNTILSIYTHGGTRRINVDMDGINAMIDVLMKVR